MELWIDAASAELTQQEVGVVVGTSTSRIR
jgi:hypothetical protein